MTRPRILLTNDDGVNSVGIWAAYEALSAFADVTVCAPAVQQSAAGRSISIFDALRMNEVIINGHIAYAVGGKPVDALLLGLYGLKCKPDMVVSGVNIGENISTESVTTSGTVGAAMEAVNQGIPAIAFSMEMANDGDKFSDPRTHKIDFTQVKKVISDLVPFYLREGFPNGAQLINVNIPACEMKGYKATKLAPRIFDTSVEKRLDPRGKPYYWICGDILSEGAEDTDVYALQHGYVSVTPLTLDNTAFAACDNTESQLHRAGFL
ncbi:MAG TPA: 5'/3'-nucleotidase SurE [Methanocorpusculum sp.]|nr:5'/3'-nucleotidase SurE [Methanocorpusculum sp.]